MTDVIRMEQEIFDLASQMDSPELRSSYVKQACGGDTDLESRLFALLAIHGSEDDLLDHSPEGLGETVDSASDEQLIGKLIGSYKPLQKIGEGGFGVVFMAEQIEPVRRKVALKIIKPGMDSKEVVARFESERQALAMMNHPNIANVLDGGRTTEGRPYFVMELVRGVSLTEYCDKKRLSLGDRLALFMDVCRALQHAHQKGIIHRDIKPSNVMVTLHDGTPIVKVIDFGVAKAINQQLTEKTLFTRYGQMVGTPQYMSPEQAEMSGLDVDTRSDIYSLGVLLYELLVGTTPLTEEKFRKVGYVEMQRLICEEELARPSNRLSTTEQQQLGDIAEHRGLTPENLTSEIRGDLEWIVMRTLEKDRDRRYPTPMSLCQDLERYLLHEPVEARPPSYHYRVSKYIRRNRALVATVASIIAILTLSTIFSTGMWAKAANATNQANRQRISAEAAREAATALTTTVREQAKRLEGQVYESFIGQAADLQRDLAHEEAKIALDRCPPHLRDWEWDRLNTLLGASHALSVSGSEVPLFSKAGNSFITCGGGVSPNSIRSWDGKTGDLLDGFEIPTESYLCMNALHPGGSLVAAADPDGNLFIVDFAQHKIVHEIAGAHDGRIDGLAFSPDGKQCVSTGWDRVLNVWSVETGKNLRSIQTDDQLRSAEFDPTGRFLATACLMGNGASARIWDAHTLTVLYELKPSGNAAYTVAFSPDGNQLVAAGQKGAVEIWRTDTWETVSEFGLGNRAIRSIRFSSDGKRIAAASKSSVLFASVDDGAVIREVNTGLDNVYWINFCPDDRILAVYGKSIGQDATQLHDLSISDSGSFTKLTGMVGAQLACGKFSVDGRFFAAGGDEGTINVWDTSSAEIVHALPVPGASIGCLCWAGDNRLFSYDGGSSVRAWDVRREEETWSVQVPGPWPETLMSQSMVISPDGTQLFVGDAKGSVWILDSTDGKEIDRIQIAGGSPVRKLAISNDGAVLAAGNYSAKVRLFDLSTKAPCGVLPLRELAKSIAFSPDSKRCAVAESSHRVAVFDVESNRRIFRRPIGASGLSSIAYSQSGRRLFVLSKDRIHVMDAQEGHDLYDWKTPTGYAMDVCHPTRSVATVGKSGEIRIYEPTPVQRR